MTTKSFLPAVMLALAAGCSSVPVEPVANSPSGAPTNALQVTSNSTNDAPSVPAAGAAPTGRGNRGGGRGSNQAGTLASQMLAQGDQNADRRLTKAEFSLLADAWFSRLDPENAGQVSQEEFLAKFGSLSGVAGAGQRGGGGGGGSGGGALAFFTVVDANKDAVLTRAELKGTFEKFFDRWNTDRSGLLNQERLADGWNSVLPRTNLSGAGGGRESQAPIPGLPTPPPSPVLAPDKAIQTIQVVDGFRVELAASEPLVEDPIALSFDEDGRLYVLEMRGFMLDINRSGERDPISRISRLEDTDGDGRFDKSTVFVDGLVLPRAVAAVRGGVLYVSNYQLYFARDTDGDGKADRTELVDADYGGGNVEHAPNGLMIALDNWIYNAKSATRYRWMGNALVKQATEFRGQWGIAQDNYGRLIYNVNNSQLLGDFTPPNYLGRNPHHATTAGLNLFVATDQRVFTIRMNTAVNRGYSPDVLDPSGKVYVFASSCSPVIYRGDNYPAEFVGNAFVCDPAVNLIKRNLVSDRNLTLTSQFAYEDREFLASTDERFRPSNLYNGPDGTLWVVDMYRGISQYSAFMTSYLRRETLARGLDQGIHYGRIYRIVSRKKAPAKVPRLSQESSTALIERLSSPNGWIRDTAQRLLIERGDRSIAPALARFVSNGRDPLGRIHALWTLEGLFVSLAEKFTSTPATSEKMVRLVNADANLSFEAPALPPDALNACLKAVGDANPKVQVAAIRVCESLTAGDPARQQALLKELARLTARTPEEVQFQAALTAGNLSKPDAMPVLAQIASRSAQHLLVREAVVSGLKDWEVQFLQVLLSDTQWTAHQPGRSMLLQSLASAVIRERLPARIDSLLTLAARQEAAQAWRQRSLLDGIAANTVRAPRAIAFNSAPAAFGVLAKSSDLQIREQSERIKSLFAWPGHQLEATAASTQAAQTLSTSEEFSIAEGKKLYQQTCAGCHGMGGEGLKPLAPPLINSEWVLGPENRLIRIVLHGMTGPVTVNGTTYQPPAVQPEMLPLAVLEDAQIAAILSYVRRDWGHEATPVAAARIATVRNENQSRELPWTEEQLSNLR